MSRGKWIAGALSLLQPGLGQIYIGRPWRGLAFAIGMMALVVATVVLMLEIAMSWWAVAILFAFFLLAWVGVVADAVRTAGRVNSWDSRPWYSRWYGYIGLLLLALFVLQPVFRQWIDASIAEAFRIPSPAMAPTLLPGDYVVVNKLRGAGAERGEVIEFSWVGDGGTHFLKRVVALGGDTVQMRGRVLAVDGKELSEPYAQSTDRGDFATPEMRWQTNYLAPGVDPASYHPTNDAWGPIVVPEGSVFVLGDNREVSEDSRERGFVREEQIEGRGGRVYLSREPSSGRWRWSRVGLSIR